MNLKRITLKYSNPKWYLVVYLLMPFTIHNIFDFLQDVCHIWELGGGTLFTKLLETPLSPLKLPNIHVVIMVDLSKPEELWFTLETLIGM